jgi:hypothetical protein
MATAIHNKPVETLRERGGVKATIWKNSSTKGSFYSIEISRTYKTESGYGDSRSFNDGDLLIIARLATNAHDRIGELKAKDAAERRAAEQQPVQLEAVQ